MHKNKQLTTPLTIEQILSWADAHFQRFERWPNHRSGVVFEAAPLTWLAVNACLWRGHRGLPGGITLARLLLAQRAVPNPHAGPKRSLTVVKILHWADIHYRRSGQWPTACTGRLVNVRYETWQGIDTALRQGRRGLPGGPSLVRLLAEHRGRRNQKGLPPLSLERVLQWIEASHSRTGEWPTSHSGPVSEESDDTWQAVGYALKAGGRGLPVRTTLAKVVRLYRNVLLQAHPEIPLSDGRSWGGTPAEVTIRILMRRCTNLSNIRSHRSPVPNV